MFTCTDRYEGVKSEGEDDCCQHCNPVILK